MSEEVSRMGTVADVVTKIKRMQPRERRIHAVLTNRQVEIARLIGQGFTSREVAAVVNLSIATVETHRTNIARVTQTRNACQLLIWLCRENLLDIEELPDTVSPANPCAAAAAAEKQ